MDSAWSGHSIQVDYTSEDGAWWNDRIEAVSDKASKVKRNNSCVRLEVETRAGICMMKSS